MRAVVIDRFGPPGVLEVAEVPDPRAGAGQVLIDVEYVSVTFVETQVRAGTPPDPRMLPELPAVLGNGVGGVVVDAGDGAEPGLVGLTVVATTGGRNGYAERAAVDAATVIPVPDGLALADATALLADGRTALALVRAAAIRPGQVVLVEAAAGGVGTALVQLSKQRGARVIACASSPEKLAVAAKLGADVLADYSDPRWIAALRDAGPVDVLFDGVGGRTGEEAATLLRRGGRWAQFGMASGAYPDLSPQLAARDVLVARGIALTPPEARALSVEALEEAAAGLLRPVVGQVLALEEAAEAHAAIDERRTTGKTLLHVSRR